MAKFIKWFDSIGSNDVAEVGGKNAQLGEMYSQLTPAGVLVPNGFAVTAEAFRYLMAQSNNLTKLHALLDDLDKNTSMDKLGEVAAKARDLVYRTPLPIEMESAIINGYQALIDQYGSGVSLAVRSSATAEDLPTASFAGPGNLLDSFKKCLASLFTERAIHYRIDKNFDHFKVAMSVGVQKMVRSDLKSSGVMFTLDTESGFRDVVFITSAYGLGETVVQGSTDPDEFYVHKPTFKLGYRAVLRKVMGSKKIKMIYSHARHGSSTRVIPVPVADQHIYSLQDNDILQLTEYAIKLEAHYKNIPLDIEWAKDGDDQQLYLVQVRPETVISSRKTQAVIEQYAITDTSIPAPVLEGHAIGSKIAAGHVRVINDVRELNSFCPGEVLVADSTTPDWEPVMKIASAIITNRGGRTCHSAIVARELQLPAVIGTSNGTSVLKTGDQVTVSCAQGDRGCIYDKILNYDCRVTNIELLAKPRTKIMCNVANPSMAFKESFLPVDGVGLARMEFIIAEHIKVHPMALLHPGRVENQHEREHIIPALTRNYSSPKDYFIERLSEGVGMIAAAFYPREVIVRMSDFKSNEYKKLIGGKYFEVDEENPMLGLRGASRYAHPTYAEAFELECVAMKRVREVLGLQNLSLMVPFCRTVEEAKKVLALMESFGLNRDGITDAASKKRSSPVSAGEQKSRKKSTPSPSTVTMTGQEQTSSCSPTISLEETKSLKVYMMCEIPNNVICADSFLEVFDGFSIGSNDLTQLCLGVDRDSSVLASLGLFDERQEGVKKLMSMAIASAKQKGKYCGICGEAPSDYPEIAEFLVKEGIQSMSLNPDSVIKTIPTVLAAESTQV